MNDKMLKVDKDKMNALISEIENYSFDSSVEMAQKLAWLIFESELNCTYAEIHSLQHLARTKQLFTKEVRNCIDVCYDTAFEVINAIETFLLYSTNVYEEFTDIDSNFNNTYQRDFKNRAFILYGLGTYKTSLNSSEEKSYDLNFRDETLKELLSFSIKIEKPNFSKTSCLFRS